VSRKQQRSGAFAALSMRPAAKGRDVDPRAHEQILELLQLEPRSRDLLIEHLHKIQDRYGYLSVAHLNALAYEMRLTPAEVFEVASFYHHFDIVKEGDTPPAPITVRVCESIACHLAGSDRLLHELQASVGANVRVIAAPCIGLCDGAPAALAGKNALTRADAEAVLLALSEQKTETRIPSYIGYAEYRAHAGYQTFVSCLSGARSVDQLIATVEASGLRGLGGAGFPSSRKWQFVRKEPAPRIAVLNADEGEPGTFKDRHCFETDPHRVLEGLLIAAWVVEASVVYIYLRDEYAAARDILTREIAALQANPPGPLPPIHVRRGAGAYICGEETALIESIEGKRGEPRLRPPFPAQWGVFGRPTLVHNVETVYWLREILEQGPEVFAERGLNERQGMRLFSVSGRVQKPGVYLAPNGVSARQLIDQYAGGMLPGQQLYAFLPGGASGGILPASLADEPLDFDVLAKYGCFIGSAALVVLSDQDSAKAAALNLMQFFAHESCGKCTPCRQGTAKSVEIMKQSKWDLPLLADLGQAMADASICGLGQAAPNPVRCVQQFFADELERV
jgi:NADH:ubiquinone oxidoreductase subunit F (NADH-binding)/NADH:ubiquinone oxidoreductase subunit E